MNQHTSLTPSATEQRIRNDDIGARSGVRDVISGRGVSVLFETDVLMDSAPARIRSIGTSFVGNVEYHFRAQSGRLRNVDTTSRPRSVQSGASVRTSSSSDVDDDEARMVDAVEAGVMRDAYAAYARDGGVGFGAMSRDVMDLIYTGLDIRVNNGSRLGVSSSWRRTMVFSEYSFTSATISAFIVEPVISSATVTYHTNIDENIVREAISCVESMFLTSMPPRHQRRQIIGARAIAVAEFIRDEMEMTDPFPSITSVNITGSRLMFIVGMNRAHVNVRYMTVTPYAMEVLALNVSGCYSAEVQAENGAFVIRCIVNQGPSPMLRVRADGFIQYCGSPSRLTSLFDGLRMAIDRTLADERMRMLFSRYLVYVDCQSSA